MQAGGQAQHTHDLGLLRLIEVVVCVALQPTVGRNGGTSIGDRVSVNVASGHVDGAVCATGYLAYWVALSVSNDIAAVACGIEANAIQVAHTHISQQVF